MDVDEYFNTLCEKIENSLKGTLQVKFSIHNCNFYSPYFKKIGKTSSKYLVWKTI